MDLGSLREADIYCPHCDDFVPKTTFYRHKKQFYNVVNGEWGDDNLLMKHLTRSLAKIAPEIKRISSRENCLLRNMMC